MNFTIFYNVSRFVVRNTSILKFQPNSVAILRRNYKIELPTVTAVATASTSNVVTRSTKITKTTKQDAYEKQQREEQNHRKSYGRHNWRCNASAGSAFVSAAFLFNLFKSNGDEEETPEDKLISTIKRSILNIQQEEYEKAERMLHLALRMAQDLHSQEGITYVYDVMANLAMEREQFKKAEKLFAEVMKRLFADGHTENSPQIMHISSKLAHMAQLQGELEKALQGFTWTLKKIDEYIRKNPTDKDVQELRGLTKNWFGQLQMKQGKYAEAKKSFKEAYECLVEIYGRINGEAVTILNNLSVACVNLDEFLEAKKNLQQALDLVKELDDTTQEAILQANMGLIHLREGLISEAKEACSLAWRIGKKTKNQDAIEQAEYCFEEIKNFTQ